MKIIITIQTASDGGAFITMDPSAETLVAQVDAGRGTTAHLYAMKAYQAMLETARKEAAEGGYMETGEIPPAKH